MRKPDEIMAEHLLKGGKMLAKTCSDCGSPLFEVKGETFCVVCRERADEQETKLPDNPEPVTEKTTKISISGSSALSNAELDLSDQCSHTIKTLLIRIEENNDPRSVKEIAEAVKILAEVYALILQE